MGVPLQTMLCWTSLRQKQCPAMEKDSSGLQMAATERTVSTSKSGCFGSQIGNQHAQDWIHTWMDSLIQSFVF